MASRKLSVSCNSLHGKSTLPSGIEFVKGSPDTGKIALVINICANIIREENYDCNS